MLFPEELGLFAIRRAHHGAYRRISIFADEILPPGVNLIRHPLIEPLAVNFQILEFAARGIAGLDQGEDSLSIFFAVV